MMFLWTEPVSSGTAKIKIWLGEPDFGIVLRAVTIRMPTEGLSRIWIVIFLGITQYSWFMNKSGMSRVVDGLLPATHLRGGVWRLFIHARTVDISAKQCESTNLAKTSEELDWPISNWFAIKIDPPFVIGLQVLETAYDKHKEGGGSQYIFLLTAYLAFWKVACFSYSFVFIIFRAMMVYFLFYSNNQN